MGIPGVQMPEMAGFTRPESSKIPRNIELGQMGSKSQSGHIGK